MKTIWTNGCFDILHIGHIRLFEYAKSLGDELIIGIDSDDRVKLLKGNDRPINNQNIRLEILSSIKYIDGIVVFSSEDELVKSIQKAHVDTIIVGDDYKHRRVIGSDSVKNVIFFPKIPDTSTTKIYESIRR